MKDNVLITGGAGFMGSHVADELIRAGYQAVILDDLSGGFRDNVPKKSIFTEGSITDHKLIDTLFEEYKFKHVFHLAAYAAEGLSHFIRRFNYENNLIGSVNLINASVKHNIKCFVFTSSIAVYGSNQVPMTEELVPEPEDPYGVSKYAVELDLKLAHRMFGLNYIVFRPHNVYGERQNIGDKYRNVIGIFINKIMQGEPLPIFGDGEQVRAFSHISDVAPVIAGAINNPKALNQVFNIGDDNPYSVKVLADVVSKAMGVEPNLKHYPARDEVKIAYSDHSKAKSMLGYSAATRLEDGVQRMVAWAKSVGVKKSAKFQGIEIEKNIPSVWLE